MFPELKNIKTPEDLHKWMDKELTYEGIHKGKLYTPKEVMEFKKGHCWETTELERYVLTHLGYSCRVIYLESKKCTATHTALIIEKDSSYVWFEWAWYKHNGIHSYDSVEDLYKDIYNKFKQSNGNITVFTKLPKGSMFGANCTEDEFIEKARNSAEIHLSSLSKEEYQKPQYLNW